LKQISLKGDVNYCINHKVSIFYEYLLCISTLKLKKNLINFPKTFCEFPPRFFWIFEFNFVVHAILQTSDQILTTFLALSFRSLQYSLWYKNITSSDRKKSTLSLWKLINFYPNKQIWPNKLIKLNLSNHDNTQFVWV